MKKLISELRELLKLREFTENGYRNDYVLSKLEPIIKKMESERTREPKHEKFVVLMDNGICYILKRKDISSICFRLEPYEKVTLCMKNGRTETFKVSENQEVLENLIADFKG